ncbi:haloacid dehalogenase-like hydrolase [Sandaracinus amylolyticus]|uniref:haloacid dehalogenase-like hydrolase n=1 Tax=Sandaracinus amylolyticus TaxID=927083 RepID=UPI001F17AE2D|nr:haloacid dehalogenase-like hydrolase [Sandaracinus amylolyticus]
MRTNVVAWGWCLCVALAACGAPRVREERVVPVTLREEGWLPENRARIERVIATLGAREGRRVAVFDWDNTMMRGDIGDLVLAHLIERGAIAEGAIPRDDAMLGEAAHAALAGARDATERGRVVAHLAWRGTTPEGEPAFTVPMAPFYRSTYGVIAQVLAAGRTDDALRAIAREAFAAASAAPVGTREVIGGVEVERFARLHVPMIELARALESVGVEVWIVSASPEPIVQALAEIAGLAPARVIGVRMQHDGSGRGTARFEACGEGALATPVMTWLEGKRCWINRAIFDVPAARQRMRQEDPALRPVLVAGDSDGDLAMLQDATELRIVLDRQNVRLMCNALASGWLVQPLFVDPPPPRETPYPCSTHEDALGRVVDADGRAIGDR